MRHRGLAGAEVLIALAALTPAAGAAAQLPLGAPPSSGQLVYPVFEGWYRNPDGSFSISFGYFNRNSPLAFGLIYAEYPISHSCGRARRPRRSRFLPRYVNRCGYDRV